MERWEKTRTWLFVYDGNWVLNSMDGRGSAVYPNGQQYNGLFSHGRREGRGTIVFTNGAIYEGRFRDDSIDGQGTMKMPQTVVVPTTTEQTPVAFNELNSVTTAATVKVTSDADTDDASLVPRGDDKMWEETLQTHRHRKHKKPDFMIPVSFQSDMGHIHRKAGFTHGGK